MGRCGCHGCPPTWQGRWDVCKHWCSSQLWFFIKRWAWVLVVVGFIVLGFWLPTTKTFQSILAWIDSLNPAYGILAFVSIQTTLTIFMLPGAIFVIFAGFAKGFWFGTFLAWTGSVLGAVGAFLIGRQLIAERVRKWASDSTFFMAVLRAIDSADEGWKITLLIRLSPLTPFALINYLLSSTQMSLWTYSWTTAAGVLPPTMLYVYLGTTAAKLSDILKAITDDDDDPPALAPLVPSGAPSIPWVDILTGEAPSAMDTTQLWVMGIGVVITIAVAVLITIFSSRAIKKESRQHQPDLEGLQTMDPDDDGDSEDSDSLSLDGSGDMVIPLKELSGLHPHRIEHTHSVSSINSTADLLAHDQNRSRDVEEDASDDSESLEPFQYRNRSPSSSRLSIAEP